MNSVVRHGSATIDRIVRAVTAVPDDSERRAVAFTAAMIALTAKMAKADGVVTADEVQAVRALFDVPAGEERNVRRLFNIARQDVAGFDAYAARVRQMFPDDQDMLCDVLEALFFVATADGVIHELEMDYLRQVAHIFGFDEPTFERIAARHVLESDGDPYKILGLEAGITNAELKSAYRKLVTEHHPDRALARGLPEELVEIANKRLAAINTAYGRVRELRGL